MIEKNKNPNAVALGKLGGKKVAQRGPEYYAQIQAKRRERKGGRPMGPPKAEHEGVLRIGEQEIPCAVLSDGSRVISQRGFARAIGASTPMAMDRRGAGNLPVLLTASNLSPFIDNDLAESAKPIVYKPLRGGRPAFGIAAEAIPKICEVWLRAREARKLRHNQVHLARAAEIVVRGLARVGIVALVDEATGYQNFRARRALEEILEKFIAKELRTWARTFPDEFYEHMFRLRGWEYDPESVRRPILVGTLTNSVVYERLAPGVLEELKKLNPKTPKGYRKNKHFQWLTQHIGDPRLREHLASIITLMRIPDDGDWETFIRMLDKALPKYKPLPLLEQSGL